MTDALTNANAEPHEHRRVAELRYVGIGHQGVYFYCADCRARLEYVLFADLTDMERESLLLTGKKS